MNLSRCEKGHFYDKEKYATCPHCAGGSANDESLTTVFTQDVTVPTGSETEQFAPDMPYPVASMQADQITQALDMSNMDTPTMPLKNDETEWTEASYDDNDHTVGYFDESFFGAPMSTTPIMGAAPKPPVNKVSTPCVGWLIALGGGHIGTDFRLKVGKNFIGRNPDMDVALTEDKSVSRDRHAVVVYEPKTHLYFVQPGESSTLVYRNNEVVLTPMKLEAYDMITVGEVNLLFLPLCGDRFNWSDLLDDMRREN